MIASHCIAAQRSSTLAAFLALGGVGSMDKANDLFRAIDARGTGVIDKAALASFLAQMFAVMPAAALQG